MKKVAIGIVAVITVLFLGFLGLVMSQPGAIHVERSIQIDGSAEDIEVYAFDLKKVNEWSPWMDLDPNLTQSYTEPTNEVGARYSWEGNADVGKGHQTIESMGPGEVVHGLEFVEPMAGVATATLTWTEGDDGLAVTWAFDQTADFGTKIAMVFMDFDEVLGPDFQKGLDKLKPLVETAAAERKKAEEAAAEAEADDGVDDADDGEAEE